MKGVDFSAQTRIMGKPQSMTNEECYPLPIQDVEVDGYPAMRSCWALSDEDLEMINKTKRIGLDILGNMHPPVSLFAWPIKEESETEKQDNCLSYAKDDGFWDDIYKSSTVWPGPKNPPIIPNSPRCCG